MNAMTAAERARRKCRRECPTGERATRGLLVDGEAVCCIHGKWWVMKVDRSGAGHAAGKWARAGLFRWLLIQLAILRGRAR